MKFTHPKLPLLIAETLLLGDARNYAEDDRPVNKLALQLSAVRYARELSAYDKQMRKKKAKSVRGRK